MNILKGLIGYYMRFGVRGVLAISAYRLFGAPKEIVVKPNRVKHPVHLRLRTSDVAVYSEVLLAGQYDVELSHPPRTIVDAGANVGIATAYYASKYPEAKIVAVEPEPTNYAMLIKNVTPYTNVVSINAALWNRDDQLHLGHGGSDEKGIPLRGEWAFRVAEKGIPVRGMTMRTLMRETGLDSIELLKMDIEGAEVEAFTNCDWMNGVQAIAIELHDRMRPGCRSALNEVTKGFRSWDRGEVTFYVRDHGTTSPFQSTER